MKKLVISFLALTTIFLTVVGVIGSRGTTSTSEYKVAMISDFADINDASFNQTTYEASKSWCDENNVPFNYYKPTNDTEAERTKCAELAIERGHNVIILPGYAFAPTLETLAVRKDVQEKNVKFIGIDMSQSNFSPSFVLPKNAYCALYKETFSGYMAGYASIKNGFRKLGFLGGLECHAVSSYGYGFLQGINDATKELKDVKTKCEFVYGGQFFGDNEITKYVDGWFKKNDTEVIFACGGSIFTSASLAARDNGGYVIGVDNDQAPQINKDYGKDRKADDFVKDDGVICVTSATKGIAATISNRLDALIKKGEWTSTIERLGLVSPDYPELNYVQLPMDTWSMKNYTIENYKTLVKVLFEMQKSSHIIPEDDVDLGYDNFINKYIDCSNFEVKNWGNIK